MPTMYLHRTWCKSCADFTKHFRSDSKLSCQTCKTEFSEVLLSEIPEEKIKEQRERYKEWKLNHTGIASYLNLSSQSSSFFEKDVPVELSESDAGQASIDQIQSKKREKEYEKRRLEREKLKEEKEKYKHLGRNETCLCGSNLKYKKCCWGRIN